MTASAKIARTMQKINEMEPKIEESTKYTGNPRHWLFDHDGEEIATERARIFRKFDPL